VRSLAWRFYENGKSIGSSYVSGGPCLHGNPVVKWAFLSGLYGPAASFLGKTAQVFPQGLELFSFKPAKTFWGSPERSFSLRKAEQKFIQNSEVNVRRIAIYCRTDAGSEYGISAQREALEEIVADWLRAQPQFAKVTRIYEDEGFDEFSLSRPGLSLLREAVRAREIDLVVALNLSRLSRSSSHLFTLGKEFFENGVKAISLQKREEGAIEAKDLFPHIELVVSISRPKVKAFANPRLAAGE
jgi:hypothetical protein